MLIPLVTAALTALLQAVPPSVQTVASTTRRDERARSVAVDSVRALRTARRAQETFEYIRKQYLPREYGIGSHHCDVHVGRWCVWNDETNDRKAPPDAPRVREARARLIALLDSLGEQHPGDEWIAAQSIRYLMESRRYADAIAVAKRCTASASRYRCRAFAGIALHDSGAVPAADSAFRVALSAMPDSVRCTWTDISLLLDDDVGDRYEHADCATRQEIENAFWHITTPLYLRDHDFRNEFLARVARTEMERDSRTPLGSPSEPAFRETALRYGYDTWFVRDDPPAGSMAEAPVAGYREGGSGFNFVPAYEIFSSPATLTTDDWDLKLRSARTIYAPSYAHRFRSLTRQQIALFRRGDSALVIATYDVSEDTLFARAPIEAGLFTARVDSTRVAGAHGTVESHAAVRGLLQATGAWRPMLVSLELLDRATQSAARLRVGVRPKPIIGRVSVSDLLMFAPASADSTPHILADALPLALHDDHVSASKPLGIFWETYGVSPRGESMSVALSVERIKEGWTRRAAERLHLATPFTPMKMQWQEVPDRGDSTASRSVTIDLSRLSPGRYEISLTLTPTNAPAVVAKRELVVTR